MDAETRGVNGLKMGCPRSTAASPHMGLMPAEHDKAPRQGRKPPRGALVTVNTTSAHNQSCAAPERRNGRAQCHSCDISARRLSWGP